MNLYIDIETIPCQRNKLLAGIPESITPPANYKKAETIEKWEAETKPDLIEAEIKKTGLNGTLGEIICIAWAIDDGEVKCAGRTLEKTSEVSVLNEFMSDLASNSRSSGGHSAYTWVGHNIVGFDLRFIWNRCVINNIKPKITIPYDAKPWDKDVFDTCTRWKGQYQGSTSGKLDVICKAMGHEGKGDLDGSKVWDYVKEGRCKEVFDYCKQDVEMTRFLYKRMNFQS